MSSPLNKFNWLSGFYDKLARIIFGKSFFEAQIFYLTEIPKHSKVLILGGGTGWILYELLCLNPSCQVWYIEASSSMLDLARKRTSGFPKDQIHFIHGTQESIPMEMKFDCVVTNFFLDLFSTSALKVVTEKVTEKLTADAIWLVTDFVNQGKWWHHLLLKIMYQFFRLTCRIESNQLPDWESQLVSCGLNEIKSKFFFRSFIKSSLLVKQTSAYN